MCFPRQRPAVVGTSTNLMLLGSPPCSSTHLSIATCPMSASCPTPTVWLLKSLPLSAGASFRSMKATYVACGLSTAAAATTVSGSCFSCASSNVVITDLPRSKLPPSSPAAAAPVMRLIWISSPYFAKMPAFWPYTIGVTSSPDDEPSFKVVSAVWDAARLGRSTAGATAVAKRNAARFDALTIPGACPCRGPRSPNRCAEALPSTAPSGS